VTDEKRDKTDLGPDEILDLLEDAADHDAYVRALAKATPDEIEKRLRDKGALEAAERIRRPWETAEQPAAEPRQKPAEPPPPSNLVALRPARRAAPMGLALAIAAMIVLGLGIAYRAYHARDEDVAKPNPHYDARSEDDEEPTDAGPDANASKSAEAGR
jgi:hypothetical protein